MTSGRRSKQNRRDPRRARRAGERQGHDYTGPDAPQAVSAAWASNEPGSIEEAKRRTHDWLIASTGTQRRGGVTWRIISGEDAYVALDDLSRGASEADANAYRQIRACFREYGGVLIVASCPAIPPPGTKFVRDG